VHFIPEKVNRMPKSKGAQDFHKLKSYLEIPGAIRLTHSKSHTEDQQIVDTKLQNIVP
jgi:hypothetical protein